MNEPTEMVECVVCGFVPKHQRRKLREGYLRPCPSILSQSVTSACRCGGVDCLQMIVHGSAADNGKIVLLHAERT
jgi:hypothetical protein